MFIEYLFTRPEWKYNIIIWIHSNIKNIIIALKSQNSTGQVLFSVYYSLFKKHVLIRKQYGYFCL